MKPLPVTGLLLAAALAFSAPIHANTPWVDAFWSGNPDRALTALERNLNSSDPDPDAVQAWVSIHLERDTLGDRLAAIRDTPLHAQVVDYAEVRLLRRQGRHQQVVDRFAERALQGNANPYFLWEVQASAQSVGLQQLATRILVRGIADYPDTFQLVWALIGTPTSSAANRDRVAQALADGTIAADTPAAEYLGAYLSAGQWEHHDSVLHGLAWLQRAPSDTRAMMRVVFAYNTLQRFEEAAPLVERAIRANPYYTNTDPLVLAYARTDRLDDARTLMEAYTRGYHGRTANVRFAEVWAGSLRAEGNQGEARRVIADALATHPENASLHYELGRVEIAERRYDQAADHLERAIELRPDRAVYWEYLLQAYQSGERASTVLDTLERMELVDLPFDEAAWHAGSTALSTLQRTTQRREWMARAVAALPESAWMHREYAAALAADGRTEEAARVLLDAFALSSENAWAYARLREWQPSGLDALVQQFPTQSAAWRELAALAETRDAKLAIWRRAIAHDRGSAMPWEGLVAVYTAERDWPGAIAAAREALTALQQAPPAQRAVAEQLFGRTVAEVTRHTTLERPVLDEAAMVMQRFLDEGGMRSSFHDAMRRIDTAREDKPAAGDHALQAARLTRDCTRFHDLVANHTAELGYRAWRFGYECLARSPRDRSNLADLMHKHVMWGGSSVVALALLHEARALGVEETSGVRGYEARAFGDLGDGVRRYEGNYQRQTAISPSDLYVGWYETARRDVLSSDRKRVHVIPDQAHPTVDIVSPDGTVLRRVHERIQGKLIEASQGGAWIRAQYNDDGHIVRVENSAGRYSEWDYVDGRIMAARSSDAPEIKVAYNDAGRPIRIDAAGTGTLFVTYDEDGEIQQVTTSDPENQARISLEVTRAFQGMMANVREMERVMRDGRMPDLPSPDPAYDRLVQGEDRLALARHMVVNRSLRSSHASDAKDLLESLIADGQDRDASREQIARVVPSIMLWQDLIVATRPYGVSDDDYGRWSQYQRWLLTAAEEGNRAARQALQRPVQSPERMEAPWFVRHAMGNAGYWRRYANDSLLPATLRESEKRAMLVRANGDVVVGTAAGLSVLRDGHWSWFAFDPRPGTFVQPSTPPARDARASVTALAETADGTLWVGSEDGLFAIADDYTDRVREWRTPRDGLPSSRIQTLAAAGEELWIGTSAGLRLWDGTAMNAAGSPADGHSVLQVDISVLDGMARFPRLSLQDVLLDFRDLVAEDKQERFVHFLKLAASNPMAVRAERDELLAMIPVEGRARRELGDLLAYDTVISVRTVQGAHTRREARWHTLSRSAVDGVLFDPQEDAFLLLRNNRVTAVSTANLGSGTEIPIQGEVRSERAVYGLARIRVEGIGEVPAVMTDTGVSFFRDWRMSMMELPLREQRAGLVVGPRVTASDTSGIWFATNEAVYGFEPSRVTLADVGRVHDLLTDDELGVTWIAAGNRLLFVNHADPELMPDSVRSVRATHLALAQDGALITNDGDNIVRFERGSTRPQHLFLANHETPASWMRGPVRNITVARDGSIWVAAGSSVFRWREGEELQTYNYFTDAERFPSRSQMISRVIETVTGEIWVVASDNNHNNWQGVSLAGGLLRFTGDRFEMVDRERFGGTHWFITGYTPLDERTAIAGTVAGFVRHRDGQFAPLARLEVPSYLRLRAEHPQLWLGRRGARLEEGRWLFPSAGGIVMLNNDQWLYPARLNQLLPDDQVIGQYGGRTVHAVATDANGNVYAGTDRGLLIYRSGGGGASLLIDNHQPDLAFNDHDTWQLREQGEILLDGVSGNSTTAQIVTRLRSESRTQDALERRVGMADAVTPPSAGDRAERLSPEQATQLRQQLQDSQRERARLLARLERENFGLFQMLTLDPRELAAVNRELAPDQAVLQYIPDANALHIQVVTRDGTQMVTVEVDRERLNETARRVSHHLTASARALPDYEVRAGRRTGLRLAGVHLSPEEQYESDITWLYDTLIRPARIALGNRSQVFVVPVGALYYLPFSVLKDRQTNQFAIEQMTLGVLPSMYHLALVLRHQPSLLDAALIVGDPDGTLPGARQEADIVQARTRGESSVLTGNQATVAAFSRGAEQARVVHIATHGILDYERPEASYLVMGNGERLDVVDIQMLPLGETDLVVLSACDTGLGRSGLEVATMARAFAHARVPTVVASLWQVNDGATLTLMTNFYERLREGDDYFTALANAQRQMIALDNEYAKGEAWAGFQVFGKP